MITSPQVRLVDENGEQVGVVSTADARRRAESAGLDLMEVSPNAEPPVCKILDYGRFRYEAQKKKNEARKKQKVIEVKERSEERRVGKECGSTGSSGWGPDH